MTLRRMVLSHDDAALAALASKGLLRRAGRDLQAGRGSVDSVTDAEALVSIDDETVALIASGPAASTCSCKASGVCRHILLAVMLLREQLAGADDAEPEALPDAREQLCALSVAQLKKFAGADWDKAMALHASDPDCRIDEHSPNVAVQFSELQASVTFIAANALKDAAYKGPKTRRRLLITVAALQLRQRHGVVDDSDDAPLASGVSTEFIDDAQRAIERAVAATLPARSATAQDAFLDLAISSRCETLPRLAAELRGLARESARASERHAHYDSGEFLLLAARSYALLEALRECPNDTELTGTLRRDYSETDEIELWPLAAARWRSAAGARGLTAYAVDVENDRWYTFGDGRAAGVDHSFSAERAYDMPLWGAGTLRSVFGHQLRLAKAKMAADGSLSAQSSGATKTAVLTVDAVLQSGAAHRNWQSLQRDLSARMASGIRRRAIALPALIAPTRLGQIGFDDLHQCYHWQLDDDCGQPLIVRLPAEFESTAMALWRMGGSIRAMVCECQLDSWQLILRPVSVLSEVKGAIQITNVDFDRLPDERGLGRMMANWRERMAEPLQITHNENNPIARLLVDVTDRLAAVVENGSVGDAAALLDRVEASGLSVLYRALAPALDGGELRSVLAAAYVVSELRFTEALGVVRDDQTEIA